MSTATNVSLPAASVLETIGNTPMVRVSRFDTGPCELFLKLENQNPGGSIKDRVALSMISDAEERGVLKPGGTIVEATAGNTGLGLALVAARKGYKLILVIPDKMSKEKIFHLKAMGARILTTRSDVGKGHPDYYQDMAERIAKEEGGFYVNQFGNAANPRAHERTTGPEIFAQCEGRVDAVVCGVGSGGTITGLSRYFASVRPEVEMVLADPMGSILAHYIETGEVRTDAGSWLVEGIGEDFIPPIADLSRVKRAYSITDRESLETARTLLREQGILGGSSSGTLIAAALKYCREQKDPKRVVTFVCDSGNKYLSKMFNDFWMIDQGLISLPQKGGLRDIISRKHQEGATITLQPDDKLLTAIGRMKLYDVSQLPVVEGNKIVGILDESDVLVSMSKDPDSIRTEVRHLMSDRLETLPPDATMEELRPVLDKGLVAIIVENERFLGLITRMDLINHLRRKFV